MKELVEKASAYISAGTSQGIGLSDHQIITVLHTLLSNKKPDINFLNQVGDLIQSNKIQKINSLTNILYVFAKLKYRNQECLVAAANTMKRAIDNGDWDEFPIKVVCRNLWNFYDLNHYDEELFKNFCEILS